MGVFNARDALVEASELFGGDFVLAGYGPKPTQNGSFQTMYAVPTAAGVVLHM